MSKMRLRSFENAPGQRHVSEDDRYLYRREEPKFRLVVIGTGTMGQEHMRVAACSDALTYTAFTTVKH